MDMFEHEDAKTRARTYRKLQKMADEMRAATAETMKQDEAKLAATKKFAAETGPRAILADYASLNEEPIYTSGILLSPELVAFGRRSVQEHHRQRAENQARERKERGDG